MNPFQIIKEKTISYDQSLLEATKTISFIIEDLKLYKENPNHNKYVAVKQLNFITAMENFIRSAEYFNSQNLDIIKKQALIIEAANIKYPTIHQSLGHIYEIFLASKGRVRELGFPHNPSVSIKVI